MRLFFAAFAGALFGAGLLVSGMTNPAKVQGWLDIFGNWDPTLAFVLGGAILPMALAWRVAAKRRKPALAGNFPALPAPVIDRRLLAGSALFGLGWGIAGLCPGPAAASLFFGGLPVALFMAAMLAGMWLVTRLRRA